jgi:hypothetical protein
MVDSFSVSLSISPTNVKQKKCSTRVFASGWAISEYVRGGHLHTPYDPGNEFNQTC